MIATAVLLNTHTTCRTVLRVCRDVIRRFPIVSALQQPLLDRATTRRRVVSQPAFETVFRIAFTAFHAFRFRILCIDNELAVAIRAESQEIVALNAGDISLMVALMSAVCSFSQLLTSCQMASFDNADRISIY